MSKYQNYEEYTNDARRTLSTKFELNEETLAEVFKVLICLEAYGGHLDQLKKNIFYGKEIPELSQRLITADVSKLQEHIDSAGCDFTFKHPIDDKGQVILHSLMGIITEAVELATPFITHYCHSDKDYTDVAEKIDVVNIGEEIGDMHWYISQLMKALNLKHEEVLEKNIAKLKARYPDKFNSDNAINRNLEAERKTLE
jgi:NTP pyrophosphatase (non-canonical NTP hydrolase)